ncbi:hypothetical protein [Bartonella sp. B1098]|nr:hypothetical protein [Bartonella sp. B1098]
MGECVLKNRLCMHRFYVKAVGFMHYDFFKWGWFWSFVVQDISLEA